MAACAPSSVPMSTKAKPRARPVAMSRITRTLSTCPAWLNSALSSSSVVLYGRFPTYNLRPIVPLLRLTTCALSQSAEGRARSLPEDLAYLRRGVPDERPVQPAEEGRASQRGASIRHFAVCQASFWSAVRTTALPAVSGRVHCGHGSFRICGTASAGHPLPVRTAAGTGGRTRWRLPAGPARPAVHGDRTGHHRAALPAAPHDQARGH